MDGSKNSETDIILITEDRFYNPSIRNDYVNNILLEDEILKKALAKQNIIAERRSWSDPDMDWSKVKFLLFRTPWDYHKRFAEFSDWLSKMLDNHVLINPAHIIPWNIDKRYLFELEKKGIRIPESRLFLKDNLYDLKEELIKSTWNKAVLKPCISASARDTYVITEDNCEEFQTKFQELLQKENMLFQEFQENILIKGEVSMMFFGGTFTHSILKKGKNNDFRVQDDFGGSVALYKAGQDEIKFGKKVLDSLDFETDYARVDIMWNNQNQLVLSELELIEPELWFRFNPSSADIFAEHLKNKYF